MGGGYNRLKKWSFLGITSKNPIITFPIYKVSYKYIFITIYAFCVIVYFINILKRFRGWFHERGKAPGSCPSSSTSNNIIILATILVSDLKSELTSNIGCHISQQFDIYVFGKRDS